MHDAKTLVSMSSTSTSSDENNTAFTQLEIHFGDTGGKTKTAEFLEAAKGAVTLVEKFGKVFSPVTYDMGGNIKKLTTKYNQDKEAYRYLEDMLLKEQEHEELVATDALLWLKRALHYLAIFFQCIIDDTLNDRTAHDLTPFLKKAYSETLEPYHGWLGTQLFNVLSRFSPSRRTLLYILALEKNNKDTLVIRDMKAYTTGMSACVKKLQDFYTEHHLEVGST